MSDQTRPVPDLLASIFERHLNVNAFGVGWSERLIRELRGPGEPKQEATFRNQLANAILNDTITPAQYEELTGEDFDTQEDLNVWLRELWRRLFGDRPISMEG